MRCEFAGWRDIGGAPQIECTINGLGERAGNTALEEVVMAIKHARIIRAGTRYRYNAYRADLEAVSQLTGFVVSRTSCLWARTRFAQRFRHHQDACSTARDTYEIMRAEDVGWSTNKIVLGSCPAANAFKQRLEDLGVTLESETDVNAAFVRSRNSPM